VGSSGVSDPNVWIGGSDRIEEGLWRHEDGQFSWRGGEPNNNGEEDCLATRDDDSGRWNDFSCSKLAGFLCGMPAR
jgi:hypothetical protein